MSIRFAFLGSGSRGNALLIETSHVRVLLDCGFAARETERRLTLLGVDPETVTAILLTHEHGDHMRGVGAMARRYQLPVWMTPGTYHGASYGALIDLNLIDCHAGPFAIGDLSILPFPVPHDSREPCQFLFSNAGQRLGVLTDTGHITPHITHTLQGCDSLILEFNHDPGMLVNGPYPRALQARVGGTHGHLNNLQAVQLLEQLTTVGLSQLVASHISEKNNSQDLVKSLIASQLPDMEAQLSFASQDRVTDWFTNE